MYGITDGLNCVKYCSCSLQETDDDLKIEMCPTCTDMGEGVNQHCVDCLSFYISSSPESTLADNDLKRDACPKCAVSSKPRQCTHCLASYAANWVKVLV